LRGAFRAWLPATVVAGVLVIGLGAAAYFTFGRGSVGASPSPIPSVEIHSKEAVIAAVKHYYDVEAEARKTGNADLIDPVTIDHASIASQNFHAFIAEQTAKGKRSVTANNYYQDWAVSVRGDTAEANFTFWAKGHDVDLKTGQPLEADVTTSKGRYLMKLQLRTGAWLAVERQLLRDNVP
jgi:hypothetical protein